MVIFVTCKHPFNLNKRISQFSFHIKLIFVNYGNYGLYLVIKYQDKAHSSQASLTRASFWSERAGERLRCTGVPTVSSVTHDDKSLVNMQTILHEYHDGTIRVPLRGEQKAKTRSFPLTNVMQTPGTESRIYINWIMSPVAMHWVTPRVSMH